MRSQPAIPYESASQNITLVMTSRFRATRAVLISLLLALALPAANPQTKETTQSPKARAMGRKLEGQGVPNFGEVTPTLYRGGLLSGDGLKALKKLGINVVVDVRANDKKEEQLVESLGMKYIAIPWHCPWPHDEVLARFLKVVHENHGKKIFVHCRLGDDRTGMMVAAYRMAEEGWTVDEAMNEMRSFGFTRSHHFICPSLAKYEKEFPERLEKNPAFEEERARHKQRTQ
jgi:protein-tyrosine phosphatase